MGTNRRARPRRQPGDHYTVESYNRAIARACDKAWPAPAGLTAEELVDCRRAHRWAPNQLRHTAATRIRREFGLEAAQVVLGHQTLTVTQVYAERNLSQAQRVMGEVGQDLEVDLTLTFPNFKAAADWIDAAERDALILRLEQWDDQASPYDMLRAMDELELVEASDFDFQLARKHADCLPVTFKTLLADWRNVVCSYPKGSRDGQAEPWDEFHWGCRAARLRLLEWLRLFVNGAVPVAAPGLNTRIRSAATGARIRGDGEDASSQTLPEASNPEFPTLPDGRPLALFTKEVASILDIDTGRVSSLALEGKLNRIKYRGDFYYDPSSVVRYKRTRKTQHLS